MAHIRMFEKFCVRVSFLDEEGDGQRELVDRIGRVPGEIDWERTAATCRVINGEGLEIEFVFKRKS